MRPRDARSTLALRGFLFLTCLAGLAVCVAGPPRWERLARQQTPAQRQAADALRQGGATVGRAAGAFLCVAGAALALCPPGLTLPAVPTWRRPDGTSPAGRAWIVLAGAATRRSTRV